MLARTRSTFFLYWIAFVASLGGFLQSYVTCVIAGSLIFISKEFELTPLKEGNIASFILLGALVGSLIAGFLADALGRRYTLVLSSVIYLITAIAVFTVDSFGYLLILRFATGVAAGITSILVPIYLAEIAPPAQRGAFVSFFQFAVTIGTLVAYFVNLMINGSGDWRMMFFVAGIPAAFQLIALFFFPESPRWLLKKGKTHRAKKVMEQLGENFEAVHTATENLPRESLFNTRFFFLIAIGLILSAFQQFSGINAIVYFTPKIFDESGFSSSEAIFATFVVGIVNTLATLLTIFLIDRFGRRILLLISQIGVVITLLMLVFAFFVDTSITHILAVTAVILYIFFYSFGLGPIVWVLISEIFPQTVRAKALAVCTFISWTSNYVVVLSFPSLLLSVSAAGTFAIYSVLTLLAFLFCLRYIPETKGKSLEQLEKILTKQKD